MANTSKSSAILLSSHSLQAAVFSFFRPLPSLLKTVLLRLRLEIARASFLETVLPKTLEEGEEKEGWFSSWEGRESREGKRTVSGMGTFELDLIFFPNVTPRTGFYTELEVKCRFWGPQSNPLNHNFWGQTLGICSWNKSLRWCGCHWRLRTTDEWGSGSYLGYASLMPGIAQGREIALALVFGRPDFLLPF